MRGTTMKALLAVGLVTAGATVGAGEASAQTGGRDVMFAFDTTGSMRPYFDQVIQTTDRMAAKLAAPGTGSRVGLVEYRDVPSEDSAFQSRTVTGLTSDLGAFRAGLASLRADGGGDDPESVYSGIARSMCADWNPSSAKAIIAIGDAPAKDPEPGTGLTAQKIIDLAKGRSTDNPYCPGKSVAGSRIYVVSADKDVVAQLDRIAVETGGKAVSVAEIDQVSGAVEATVNGIDADALGTGSLTSASVSALVGSLAAGGTGS